MRSPIETKVALPALIMGPAIILVPALYTLLLAYGAMDPTPEQKMATVGLGVALQYVAHVYLGYKAPHTSRADLAAAAEDGEAAPDGRRRITPHSHRPSPAHLDETSPQ